MTSRLQDSAQAKLAEKIRKADEDLAMLVAAQAELAADVGLMGASMAPPPWGTVADVASLGKSVYTGDWGGALFDLIGVVPLVGDGIKGVGKGAKAVDRLNDVRKALDATSAALARTKKVLASGHLDEMAEALAKSGDLMTVRKTAAKRYWDDIAEAGRKQYDEAINACSTQKCMDAAILKKGPQYEYTPVTGGKWTDGIRGDGKWVPDPDGPTGKALADFNTRFGTDVSDIPYHGGHPDFAGLTVKTPKGARAQVEIAQTGKNGTDFKAADEALQAMTGHTKASLEKDLGIKLTWHHMEDGVTMQLVPNKLHGASNQVGHAGGSSIITNPEY